jgi:hypothetical protein
MAGSTAGTKGPIGPMKKIVSLVDRGAFDEYVYPSDNKETLLYPSVTPYHNFTHTIEEIPFIGEARWGQRISFELPRPIPADFLSWTALRLKPTSWIPYEAIQKLQSGVYTYVDPSGAWSWASSLGTIAIAEAEMTVDGVVLERWSGDWIDLWNRTAHTSNEGAGWDQLFAVHAASDPFGIEPSEDGTITCFLPFWFVRWINSAFPLIACERPIRFNITLRPFSQVVRRVATPIGCGETPIGGTFMVSDSSRPYRYIRTIANLATIPPFESATLLCGFANVETAFRTKIQSTVQELLMNPVTVHTFSEPLTYVSGVQGLDTIRISLPLEINGATRQLLWVLRRKAVTRFNDWTNYSAVLEDERDVVWAPPAPLLVRAQLQVGTAVWVDQDEAWWRQRGGLKERGGIRTSGAYIYAYSFGTRPDLWRPTGSIDVNRVPVRLQLEVRPPGGVTDGEWEVVVVSVAQNWLRFQEGLAGLVFME